jgi:adenosylhomocysteinase
VELTRSGVARYAGSGHPVFVADSGAIKRIETTLGTSDGFIRAMAHFGHPIPSGAHVVCFGLGKVGAGVAHAARLRGARITAIDPALANPGNGRGPNGPSHPGGETELRILDPSDREAILRALDTAWCVVAATGVEAALDDYAEELVESQALLANLGAEDEFGPQVPAERALNGKVAVNFALAEPTLLRYLDATMALSNAGAVEVALGRCEPGLNQPPQPIEARLLGITREYGLIGAELDTLPTPHGVNL